MNRKQLLEKLANELVEVTCPHPVRVAVDGVDAAGKTTFANELSDVIKKKDVQVIQASIDGFHHPRAVRYKRGKDSPEGYYYDSFDYDAITLYLLEPLGVCGDLHYRTSIFDFWTDSERLSPVCCAVANAVLVFDGVFLLRPELYGYWDFSIFLDVDFDVCLQRAAFRDQMLFGSAEDVRKRYERRYIPGQNIYLDTVKPIDKATVVIQNNDPDHPILLKGLKI